MGKSISEDGVTLFRRPESTKWYYTYKDPRTGAWKKKSTDESSYAKALSIAKAERAANDRFLGILTLDNILELYSDPDTNPRYLDAQENGTRYGYGHACHVATNAREIRELVHKKNPSLLSESIHRITTQDILAIRKILIKQFGNSSKAYHLFMDFKTFFSREIQVGNLDNNPAAGVPNVAYKQKDRKPISIKAVQAIISLRDSIPIKYYWAFAVIAAATGMRRSEVLALTPETVSNGIIRIEMAFKWIGKNRYGLGDPKCGSFRNIAEPKLVAYALSQIPQPAKNERYFPFDSHWADKAIHFVRFLASSQYPELAGEFEKLTAHVFRHTATTILLTEGAPRELIEVWMGWKRTMAGTMLDNYAHPEGEQMRGLADIIDDKLTPDSLRDDVMKISFNSDN